QMVNLRYTALGRPHSWQRRSCRVLNFGLRFALAIFALVAIGKFVVRDEESEGETGRDQSLRKGMPNSFRSSSPSSLLWADVTMAMFIPCRFFTLSALISGNTFCSVRPR